MKKLGLILVAGFFAVTASLPLFSQSEDPSDMFLKAYMTAQQGEKLEHEGQFNAALTKYRFAGSLLEELKQRHGDWQPAIVDYRSRKVSENIMRVQGKATTQQDLTAPPAQMPDVTSPALPQQSGAPETNVEIATPPARQKATPPVPTEMPPQAPPPIVREPVKAPAPAPTPNEAVIKEATKKLQKRVDELEADLKKSRDQFGSAEKEKSTLTDRLKDTSSKLEKAQADLNKSKDAEKKVRDQLADAQSSLKKAETTTGGGDEKAQAALRTEIDQLKKALATVEQGRSAAEKGRAAAERERDVANARAGDVDRRIAAATKDADQKVAAATRERDDAVGRLKNLKGAEKQVQVLVAENSGLKLKLAEAEKSVRAYNEDRPKQEKELADVKHQVDQLQQQLLASQKQNKDYEGRVVDLGKQLDDANKQLEEARTVGATAEETSRLTKENQILRNIVVRERQEEARRDQARKLMLAEFDKLKIQSDTLTEQIQLLAQPVTRLSDEELALLRQPIVSISDNNPAAIKASFTYAKKSSDSPDNSQGAQQPDSLQQAPSDSLAPGGNRPNIPDNLAPMAREAKDNFDKGRYRTAEKLYQEMLTKSPSNLYSLSNLGVVYFRTGKLKAAELTLKKAIAISPKDEFARTTLGIVYYRQSKFDDALTELTKALAINPKSATAHNYLGITASQKGWQEAAEKEMLEAIADNPNYADAHFNLAVIYATATPPAKELAKQHYVRATSLGAQPDPSLEKLIH